MVSCKCQVINEQLSLLHHGVSNISFRSCPVSQPWLLNFVVRKGSPEVPQSRAQLHDSIEALIKELSSVEVQRQAAVKALEEERERNQQLEIQLEYKVGFDWPFLFHLGDFPCWVRCSQIIRAKPSCFLGPAHLNWLVAAFGHCIPP